MTSIEWVQNSDGTQGKAWNPVTGCTKVSPGCAHCYAADIANRFWGDRAFSDVRFHPERLNEPLKRKKPTTYFVNSMSDLFHEAVTDEQLDQIFAVMALTPQHIYQVLTKRPQRMMEYCNDRLDIRRLLKAIDLPMPGGAYTIKLPLPNVWLGVTVEDQKRADERIPLLLETPAAVRFLSCEPLLESVDISEFLSHAVCQTSRGNNLPISNCGRTGNRLQWAGLEGCKKGMGQMESMRSAKQAKQVSESESRIEERRISNGKGDVRQEALFDGCSQVGLSPLFRDYSERDDSQSQGWRQAQQSPDELRISNIFRTGDAQNSCAEENESMGRKESSVKVDKRASEADQSTPPEWRIIDNNCRGLQSFAQNNIQDRVRSETTKGFWVIVGGESGPKARPFDLEWARSLVQQCKEADVPVFMKQLGSKPKIQVHGCHKPPQNWCDFGSTGKGGDPSEWPEDLRIREMPAFREVRA